MRRLAILNGRFGLLSGITVSVIALYVLSIGPMCRLARHRMVSVPQLAEIYRPLLSLDFQSPPALQDFLATYVGLCGGREKLEAARDEPFWCRYDIGDFTCRYRKRVRRPAFSGEWDFGRNVNHEPVAGDLLVELITCRIEPDTWDEVGGRGKIMPDLTTKSLRVLQPRRVQSAITKHLAELRRIRRENLPHIDFDLISLERIHSHSGEDLNRELKSHALIIDRKRDGKWEFDGTPLGGTEALFTRLDGEPREAVEMGIYVPLSEDYLPRRDFDRLVRFCRKNDVDLFVLDRKSIENVIGISMPRVTREVRRKNSLYAEPPAGTTR